MAIYSFRAESQDDVERLHQAFAAAGVLTTMKGKPDAQFPDIEVELESATDLECIRNVMRTVKDGHVMLQTLRACPLSANSLERDYDLL